MSPDLAWCRELFPALRLRVNGRPAAFFDGPGGTQVPQEVLDAVAGYLIEANANAHGEFLTSRRSDAIIEDARRAVLRLLGGTGDHAVAFGANMTTLNFSLSRAVARGLRPGDEAVITDLDHEANRAPWLALAEQGVKVRSVPLVPAECRLDMDALAAAIGPRTRVVAVGYASNAVGTINDVRRVVGWARAVGALTVIDAVHYVPHGPVDLADLGCDFLLFSAYKLFGPHVGVLCGRREAFSRLRTDRVRCQLDTPPHLIETGTLNHEGIAGTAAAVRFVARLGGFPGPDPTREEILSGMEAIAAAEAELGARLEAGLTAIPGVTLYGPPAGCPRTPTYSFTVRGVPPREVARELGEQGIFVWAGHFYAQTLVEALGLGESGGLVRAGLAPYNTAEEVDRLLEAVEGKHSGYPFRTRAGRFRTPASGGSSGP
ncbi:MAG: cysteine desulfurase-like protein [Acetobacteraceae bacterium]|nr:cysteine desulfurase-like protein [Acetobacteraceae bacterium]